MADTHATEDLQNMPDWFRRLSLRHLQLLLSLSELGSVSDTARAASTSQPALSKWLKELEDAVGAPLFERHARGLTPTHHGKVLLAHARRVVNEMARAQYQLAALPAGTPQHVIIGTTPPTAASLMPLAITDFLKRYPKARIELWESSMVVLLEKLEQSAVDIVVGTLDNYEPSENVRSEVLYAESTRIIARAGHPLTRLRRPIAWDDLYRYDWIVWPTGAPIRNKLDLALTHAGRGPLPYRVESASLTANFALIESSDLLGAVSGRLAEHFARRGGIVSLPFRLNSDSSVGVCWRQEALHEGPARDFLESLRKAAKRGRPAAHSVKLPIGE
jgi:DNA-binding transcriptional LysR family regulator